MREEPAVKLDVRGLREVVEDDVRLLGGMRAVEAAGEARLVGVGRGNLDRAPAEDLGVRDALVALFTRKSPQGYTTAQSSPTAQS